MGLRNRIYLQVSIHEFQQCCHVSMGMKHIVLYMKYIDYCIKEKQFWSNNVFIYFLKQHKYIWKKQEQQKKKIRNGYVLEIITMCRTWERNGDKYICFFGALSSIIPSPEFFSTMVMNIRLFDKNLHQTHDSMMMLKHQKVTVSTRNWD